MRVLPTLCYQCESWFMPKTKRKAIHCSNACRQSAYRGNKPYSVKFDLSDCSEGGEDQFHKILNRYKKDDMGLYESLMVMKDDNWTLYSRFIYNYAQDKFGVHSKEWINQDKLDLL